MARIGVYGGSFNPPHIGHSLAAAEMIEHLDLDRLLVVPAAAPPHKKLALGSPSAQERLELCRAAFAGVAKTEVSDIEIRREGASYTVDTLRQLRKLHPDDEIFLIMGTDMLLSFDTWREPETIAGLANLAVMHRENDAAVWEKVREKSEVYSRNLHAKIVLVPNRCIQISSTTVRRLLALGAPAYLDPAAQAMILEQGWYLTGVNLKGLDYEILREISLSLHDEKRRPHVIGCSETAEALARRYGEDPVLARRAGILHDITKALGGEDQLRLCQRYQIELSELQRDNPKLLHAKTGAAVARYVFGECEKLCSAIYWHTTGRKDMTLLEKIIYIADYMEPNRRFPDVDRLRELVWTDLDAGLAFGLELSIRQLQAAGRIIDPDSLAGWQYYTQLTERRGNP